jgi:signal transduction histidine kinase
LLGNRWLDVVHPDDRPRALEIWNGALRAQTVYMAEYRFRRGDGAHRWHLVRALPVRDDRGEVRSWVGVCIDIHDRRAAEEELRRRVEQAVAERETALFQLHEAQKLETIGQLTGGVAHDFNNLLTPIVGSLDLLRRRLEDDRSVRLIDGALASAERARALIQRLLAFARRQTLQPRAVDPGALVQGMRELIERSLGPRIDFVTEVAPGLPPALADPNQLELALLNLSVNARDAMPMGGRLEWRLREDAIDEGRTDLAPGQYVRIEIRDTGVGMDADTLARAVEPFFSTKPAGKGTGLGLSMVHGLAGQSGGGFRLDSVPGGGTTATLWLPVAAEQIAAAPREADARAASRRARVLLVDDEDQVRFTTSESLMDLGYDVVLASSAQEALEAVAAGLEPDLLVTDHLMPGMSGAQLALEMRGRIPGLPVLMITGYAQLRPEEAGDLAVLAKPYRHAELALRIAELLAEEPVLQNALG